MHLDGLPPLRVPLRYYLTAPLFGLAAGVVLFVEPVAWMSRWTNEALAAVHLLVLGFLSMVMIGSMFQVVPVLGGRAIAGARVVAPVVHGCLTLGTLVLSANLLWPAYGLWLVAIVLLLLGFGVFLVAAATSLIRTVAGGDSVFVLRLAVVALIVTIGLGVYLALGRALPERFVGSRAWTDLHATWGIGGWVALLVMGVSFQVLPMFQVAPAFGSRLARGAAIGLLVGLVAASFVPTGWAKSAAVTLMAVSLATYAGHALSVLHRRRRRRADALNGFWKLSLGSLIAVALLGWWLVCAPPGVEIAVPLELTVGVVAILGFALSVVFGMLTKVVAFLAFLHLQRRCLTDVTVADLLPTMHDFVTERAGRRLLWLHLATVAAACGAVWWPSTGRVAAGFLALDFAMLFVVVTVAARRYTVASRRIEAALSG